MSRGSVERWNDVNDCVHGSLQILVILVVIIMLVVLFIFQLTGGLC